jgi:radical SAM protein (TIGR01212 family)
MLPHERYLGFSSVLREKFGEKVYRVTLNAGMSCPNVDGTRAKGGCYFCNDDYLLAKSWHKQQSIPEQMDYGIKYIQERHGAQKFLAYFQNGTNTHAPAEKLRPLFTAAIQDPRVVGLMISTRPDCLGNDILDLLSELNERTYLWIELGLQSAHDHILQKINRAHSVAEFAVATEELARRGINNCVHMIIGMPDETEVEIRQGIEFINGLPVTGIKIHNMFVTEYTALAKWYREGKYQPLSLGDYTRLCIDYVENLRPDIIIHRLNAHGPARHTVAPEWSVNKLGTITAIHAELERRDTWQGKCWVGDHKQLP